MRKVGIWLFLASEVMLFGALFFVRKFFCASARGARKMAARPFERLARHDEHHRAHHLQYHRL